jgi:hypothetical protein
MCGTTDDDVLLGHFIGMHNPQAPDGSEYLCPCGERFASRWEIMNHLAIRGVKACLAEGYFNRLSRQI